MKIIHSFDTWLGGREQQQDDWGFNEFLDNPQVISSEGALAVVADGMGGLAFGHEASKVAKTTFLDAFRDRMRQGAGREIASALRSSIEVANNAVLELSRRHQLEGDIGTTLIAAVLKGPFLYWISVGDSRIYIARNNELVQVTLDHNYETELVLANTEYADARNHPEGHALTSYLGIPHLNQVDQNIKPFKLLPGDVVLLCSDGLFNVLPDKEILSIVQKSPGDKIANNLLAAVKPRSSPEQDNTTVLSFKIGEERRQKPPVTARRDDLPVTIRNHEGGHAGNYSNTEQGGAKATIKIPRALLATVLLLMVATAVLFFRGQFSGAQDACEARNDSFRVDEHSLGLFDILKNDTCSDEQIERVELADMGTLGQVLWDEDQEQLKFLAGDSPGVDSVTYRLFIDGDSSQLATVIINVRAVNDPPHAFFDREATTGQEAVTISPLSNDTDPEEDSLFIFEINEPQYGTLEPLYDSDRTFTYTPDGTGNVQDRIQYIVSDGKSSDTGQIIIDVNFENQRPIANNDEIEVHQSDAIAETEIPLSVLENDEDPNPGDKQHLRVVSYSGEPKGKVSVRRGQLYYSLGLEEYEQDAFTYTISDGALTSEARVTIIVTGSNTDAEND